jgi:NadR type nicotinamide-nucleotide adenylyltransferase
VSERPRRLVLTGSESTGKTTLARALAVEQRCPWSPEYSRAYAEAVRRPLTYEDVEPIAQGQILAEDEAASRALSLVVLDTDLVSTLVYCRHYYGRSPDWLLGRAQARRGDLYLLLDIDVPWVADPVRDAAGERRLMQDAFSAALREIGARVIPIGGEGPARREAAARALAEAQARGWNWS